MRRAVLLLLAGCARTFGLSDPVREDAATPSDVDAATDGSTSVCAARKIAPVVFGSDVSMSVVQTQTGYVLLAVERTGGALHVQPLTTELEQDGPLAIASGASGSLVAGVYTDRLLVAVATTTTQLFTLSFANGGGTVLAAGTTLADPIAERDSMIYDSTTGEVEVVTAHGPGFLRYKISSDGMTAAQDGGGGSGGMSSGCVASADGTDMAVACPKQSPTEALCVTPHMNTGAVYLGSFDKPCPYVSVVQVSSKTYAAYDTAGAVEVSRWDSAASPGPIAVVADMSNATHAIIGNDSDGLVLAMRKLGAVYTTRASSPAPYAPTHLDGMPPALGFALVPRGQHSILFVAAGDGIYRACI